MTEDQFNKLPAFAKNEILRLKSDNASLKKIIEERSGEGKTNTFISRGLDLFPIDNNANIRFMPTETEGADIYINSHGMINVNTDSRLGKTMVIKTIAANSFNIDFV